MNLLEWWFESSPGDKAVCDSGDGRSTDVLFSMVAKSKPTGKAEIGNQDYRLFGPKIQPNGEIHWKCRLGDNEPFRYRIFEEALSHTEQLIIAHNWPKEEK